MTTKKNSLLRQRRVRDRLKKASKGRYRLSIFRSSKNIYAQIIDDDKGKTLLSSSTLEKNIKNKFKNTGNKEAASEIGKILAEKAKEKGIKKVIFDRGRYVYHGRVKAFADGARKAGLDF
ncbi:MAG: 50S ribosomal protein L18 [Alphaproteobacteria bacterium MarineAlpha6_Bin6]|nr:50S ribosomal protein L18 [Pelagibacteraceae bacterium]PPR31720.1 MAG: 50S ribosomal protein L18 [Alphaproteobacteria bacterium MarineAlpha6_Bin6]PPR32679.1 MAG: 50S ribosomal protein L18 [Alphaproteobacteria bacterium MarineAlpha6_Bin5]|tara:strand:+ start:2409 stop:2768 length:360 start_codon:yes stop_codon:yes gene_type:complete